MASQTCQTAVVPVCATGPSAITSPHTMDLETNRLEVLGATRAYRVEPDKTTMESGFITMRDPEGNEFCLD